MLIRNMGIPDRLLRTFFGAVLVALSWPFLDLVPGNFLSYFCLFFGLINILSSAFCWCFMYQLVGISTKEKNTDDR